MAEWPAKIFGHGPHDFGRRRTTLTEIFDDGHTSHLWSSISGSARYPAQKYDAIGNDEELLSVRWQLLGVKRSDSRLLAHVSKGDASALGELYDAHSSLLAFRLRREGASVEEAEDVLQETFLDVWRTSEAYRGDAEVAAWLWGIAYRKYLMLVRGEVRLRHREERAQAPTGTTDDEDHLVVGIDAGHALSRLKPDLRLAFEAVAVEGLSTAEAAERLGVPEGTVKSRVHRARSVLRKELR